MQIGLGIGTTFRQKWVPSLTEQIRSLLFSASEPGAWYDPSDMSTLFQDSAGTVPVTAVEQPVGRILDKSGRGNHASQATTTKRPVLSRRVNLFYATLPTGLRNGTGALIPDAFGGMGGYQLTRTSTTDEVFVPISPNVLFPGASYTLDVYLAVGASSNSAAIFSLYTSAGRTSVSINYSTGVFSAGASTNGFSCSSVSSESVAGGWRTRIKFTIPTSAPAMTFARIYMWAGAPTGSPGIVVGNPQFTLITDAHLPYQWVNTDTNYDADPTKFPAYLRFDGVDDALQTGNIDFTGTDKMTVWAGVTKLSDTARGCIVELGNGSVDTSSIMYLNGPGASGGSPKFSFAAVGPVSAAHVAGTHAANLGAPSTAVMCGLYVPDTSSKLRVNGVQTSAGSNNPPGKFYIRPLYIGARVGTSLYFNGRLYSLIVRGAQSSLSQIEATEAYIKQKARIA